MGVTFSWVLCHAHTYDSQYMEHYRLTAVVVHVLVDWLCEARMQVGSDSRA